MGLTDARTFIFTSLKKTFPFLQVTDLFTFLDVFKNAKVKKSYKNQPFIGNGPQNLTP